MDDPNKSEEELEEELDPSETPAGEEEPKTEEEEPVKEPESEKEEETEEEAEATVKLSEHTRTRELLWRVAKDIVEDEDKLAELAEKDPKRIERLAAEFPKLFKDVKIPAKNLTDEDIEARISAAVAKQLTGSGKSEALIALQKDLKMSDLEFLDIKDDIASGADRLYNLELAASWKDAVLLSYKNLNPKKYKEIVAKKVAADISERKSAAKKTATVSKGTKKIPQSVLENYKKYGFSSPEEMIKYQGDKPIQLGL